MCQEAPVGYLSILVSMAFLAHDGFHSTCSCPLYGTQNDTVINPNLTTAIQFLISRKFEVTIQIRKLEGNKGLPKQII